MIGAVIYFILGILFTYLGFKYATETIFNPLSIVMLIIAAIDFGTAFKVFSNIRKRNNSEK